MQEVWKALMEEVDSLVADGESRADAMAYAEEQCGYYLAESAAIADKGPNGEIC
jgi:hypothetical protein